MKQQGKIRYIFSKPFCINVLKSTLVALLSSLIITIAVGIWNIYTAVQYNLPKKLDKIEKGYVILQQQREIDKENNSQQHMIINNRIDKTKETYNILLQNILEVKQKLNMTIDYKTLLNENNNISYFLKDTLNFK